MSAKTFTFSKIPADLAELKTFDEAALKDPFASAALTVLAFCRYPQNADAALSMLEFLKGPAGLSTYDRQFIKDRFSDKDYVPRSYFAGAVPDNDYTPSVPLKITVSDNIHSYQSEGYATLYIASGGADNPRSIRLRIKPSTGQWFADEYGGLLMSIKEPRNKNPWA